VWPFDGLLFPSTCWTPKRALQSGEPTKAGVARRKETEAVRLACEVSVGAADSDLEGTAGHQRLDVRSLNTLVESRMRLCEADIEPNWE
jgi:hypothetical protein